MTWTECAVLFLVGERGIAMAYGFYRGARAALRTPQRPSVPVTYTSVPDFVEVASEEAMSLDYSGKHKRH
jgi:hypothetical protein